MIIAVSVFIIIFSTFIVLGFLKQETYTMTKTGLQKVSWKTEPTIFSLYMMVHIILVGALLDFLEKSLN